jgi:DNA polymerase sigma
MQVSVYIHHLHSDIDIVLETSYVPMDNPSRITALRKLAKRLSKSHVVFGNRLEVIKARVPIVKFVSTHGTNFETLYLHPVTYLQHEYPWTYP